ncbi:Uncharacterised protein [Mycobacteroides abscessus subsp. abscessus]|nr:Uncharacterised protein [Mycobacteroides abscessus subsp. abscessus]
MAAVGAEAGVIHRVQDAAVHWLETIPDLGEGAAHDHAHGVIDVAALHLLLDVYRFDAVDGVITAGGQRCVSHVLLVHAPPGESRATSPA